MSAALKIVSLATLVFAATSSAQDWPRFRGPNGSGASNATGLPAEFGPAKNLRWKTAVPFSRSSPVIAGDRIFLTAAEGEKLVTMSLHRATGRILWRSEIQRPRATPIYKGNDGASPSPVTDGKNVYAFFPDLGLISFGPRGRERWRLPLGPFDTFYGLAGSPILSGDTLLLVCDARGRPFLLAVDAGSGKVRWRVERSEVQFEGYTSPILHEPPGGPAQVIVLGAKRIDSFAIASGERLWWVRGLAFYPVGSPVLSQGVLVASTYGTDEPMGPAFEELLKSDADKDGRLSREEVRSQAEMYEHFGGMDTNHDSFIDRAEWDTLRNGAVGNYGLVAVRLGERGDLTDKAVLWREKKNYPTIPTPLIYRDVLYTVQTGGIIASLEPHSGKTHKIERSKEAMDEYFASPVAADGKVYFISETGKVTVVKAQPQWEILAVNDLGEECYATPAIASRSIFIRTRGALYSFAEK